MSHKSPHKVPSSSLATASTPDASGTKRSATQWIFRQSLHLKRLQTQRWIWPPLQPWNQLCWMSYPGWMLYALKVNESKIEFIYFGIQSYAEKIQHQHSEYQWRTHSHISKGELPGRSSGQYTVLPPTCHSKMSSSQHQLKKIRHIRKFLSKYTC